ncbi:hypothetical protein BESB_010770 [Besnoitia besnoiti]|uniref:Rhodanese domain-containing protein n=1 Tax=Besnoitia besnoiti TaxID=94643 RepID=A0A2A9ML41_BESBE|nr:hypothetical protein BESB_010770 [Besnoitia besnoiti]PFH38735.1 hypothetical protein BESB_010770 [Besnoitia besnoiti]
MDDLLSAFEPVSLHDDVEPLNSPGRLGPPASPSPLALGAQSGRHRLLGGEAPSLPDASLSAAPGVLTAVGSSPSFARLQSGASHVSDVPLSDPEDGRRAQRLHADSEGAGFPQGLAAAALDLAGEDDESFDIFLEAGRASSAPRDCSAADDPLRVALGSEREEAPLERSDDRENLPLFPVGGGLACKGTVARAAEGGRESSMEDLLGGSPPLTERAECDDPIAPLETSHDEENGAEEADSPAAIGADSAMAEAENPRKADQPGSPETSSLPAAALGDAASSAPSSSPSPDFSPVPPPAAAAASSVSASLSASPSALPYSPAPCEESDRRAAEDARRRAAFLHARVTGFVSNEMWLQLLGVDLEKTENEEQQGASSAEKGAVRTVNLDAGIASASVNRSVSVDARSPALTLGLNMHAELPSSLSSLDCFLLDKDEMRLRKNLCSSSSFAGLHDGEEDEADAGEKVKKARRFAEDYCRAFSCPYTPGLLFLARILLRYFSAKSDSASASSPASFSSATLLQALHAFRRRHTSRVFGSHARLALKRLHASASAEGGASKRSSFASLVGKMPAGAAQERENATSVLWVNLDEEQAAPLPAAHPAPEAAADRGLSAALPTSSSSCPSSSPPSYSPPPPPRPCSFPASSSFAAEGAEEGVGGRRGEEAAACAPLAAVGEKERDEDDFEDVGLDDDGTSGTPAELSAAITPAEEAASPFSLASPPSPAADAQEAQASQEEDWRAERRAADLGRQLQSLVSFHLPFLSAHLGRLRLAPERYADLLLASAFASCCYADDEGTCGSAAGGAEALKPDELSRERRDELAEDGAESPLQGDTHRFPLLQEGEEEEPAKRSLSRTRVAEICVQQLWRFLVLSGEPAATSLILLALLSQHAGDLSCCASAAAAAARLSSLSLTDADAFGLQESALQPARAAETAVSRLPASLFRDLSLPHLAAAPAPLGSAGAASPACSLVHAGLVAAFRLWHAAALYGVQTPQSFSLRLANAEAAEATVRAGEEVVRGRGAECSEAAREPVDASSPRVSPPAFRGSAVAVMELEAQEFVQAVRECARMKGDLLALQQEQTRRLRGREEEAEAAAESAEKDPLVPENFLLAHWPPSLIGIDILCPALLLAAHLPPADNSGAAAAAPAAAALLPMSACLAALLDVFAFILEAWAVTLFDCRTLEQVERSGFVRLSHALLVDGEVLKKHSRRRTSALSAAPAAPAAVGVEAESQEDTTGQRDERAALGPAATASAKAEPPAAARASFLDATGLKTLLSRGPHTAASSETRADDEVKREPAAEDAKGHAENDEELRHLLNKCEAARGKPVAVVGGEDAEGGEQGGRGQETAEPPDSAATLAELLIQHQFSRVSYLVGGWSALEAALERADLAPQLLCQSGLLDARPQASVRLAEVSSAAAQTAAEAAAALQEWSSKAKEKARGWMRASASKTQALPLKWQSFRAGRPASEAPSEKVDSALGTEETVPTAVGSAPEPEPEGEDTPAEAKETSAPEATSQRAPLADVKDQAAHVRSAAATLFSQLWTRPAASADASTPPPSSASFLSLLRGEGACPGAEEPLAGATEASEAKDARETTNTPESDRVEGEHEDAAPGGGEKVVKSEPPSSASLETPSPCSPSCASNSPSPVSSEKEDSEQPSSPASPASATASPPACPRAVRRGAGGAGEPSRREKVFSSLLSSTLGGADYVKRSSARWSTSLKNMDLSRAFRAAAPRDRSEGGDEAREAPQTAEAKQEELTPRNAEEPLSRNVSRERDQKLEDERAAVLGFRNSSGSAVEVLGGVSNAFTHVGALGEAGLLASDEEQIGDGVFEIGGDEETEQRGTSDGFGAVERVGSGGGRDIMQMMKKYELYIQEIQQLEKGAIIDLVEMQKQIGDLQIFEALKVRSVKPRWSFTLAEGVVAKTAEKKSLRWLLLTLHQLIVLEPHCAEKREETEGPRDASSHAESEGGKTEKTEPLEDASGSSGVARWQGQWRTAVRSFREKAKDALQHTSTGIEQLGRKGTESAAGCSTFETITGIINLPQVSASSRRGEGSRAIRSWGCVKSNHRLSDLRKAVHFPDDSQRLSLVLCSGKTNTYDLLARAAFLEAIQNRPSLDIGVSLFFVRRRT